MDSDIIKARIEKTQGIIDKKNALIEKRFTAIERANKGCMKAVADLGGKVELTFSKDVAYLKKQNSDVEEYIKTHGMKNGDWNDAWYSVLWDYPYKIHDYLESIENAQKEIEERNRMLIDLNEKLIKAEERENIFDSMPQCMKDFMNDAIECWDAWDKMRRESVKQKQSEYYRLKDEYRAVAREKGKDSEECHEINREIRYIEESYSQFEWHELPYLDDDEIHERNVKAGKALVTDLYDRVTKIVGTFEDASELKVTRGNGGFSVINGFVRGNGKTAKVQSIGAGGYNIQRFHIRTLVHEVH